MNALTEYQRIFPEHTPSCFQQDLLEQTVTNLPAWRKTLMFWASNAYRPQSIGKMLDYYNEVIRETASITVGQSSDEILDVTLEPCGVCGKEICFQLHREELGI